MRFLNLHGGLAIFCVLVATGLGTMAQNTPALVWQTNSSVKLEQILGDVDWANGSNTASQTITRFNIVGTDLGCSFINGTNLFFLFGDTIGSNVNYKAADSFAWTSITNGETGLRLNFFTNNMGSNVFVAPNGISMAGDDTPNSAITISNQVYIICNTGSDGNATNPHAGDYSVLVTFDQSTLMFQTNRTISAVTNNGNFVIDALHLDGTNVLMFGEGNYRTSDIYLATIPVSSFLSGAGTFYFTGLTNGQPTWGTVESNAVPVVQDNPTNGPPWPNDTPSVGNMSVIYSTNLGLWLMTYDGGRYANSPKLHTTGVYFTYAPQPWGPWSTPQLIFNSIRDDGAGVFIYSTNHVPPGPAGPTINPAQNNPTNTDGGVYAPYLIEPFTRITNNTLSIYYVMSTWNPYTVVKMRSMFSILPVIDPDSLIHRKNKFIFTWNAPTNVSYQVDYASNLLSAWTTFTDVVSSTSGTFKFTNDETANGGLPPMRYYRVRTSQ